ncbi:HSP20-like chaperones superfamily protein [Heracleum sosnowskyi]|uniref:Co-chaperone protein p23 n=1 Tax=Heracleum sosnowskyi TaxID=360622 RepID=A0AAD8HP61_9APIA|nr:HSP20-like chaperones superfamily protein [Heracleum sosnowskyi]
MQALYLDSYQRYAGGYGQGYSYNYGNPYVRNYGHPQYLHAIFITVLLADTKDPKVNLESEGVFKFSATAGGENHSYELKLDLFDKVNVEESKINISPRSIFCILEKEENDDPDSTDAGMDGMDFSKFGDMGGIGGMGGMPGMEALAGMGGMGGMGGMPRMLGIGDFSMGDDFDESDDEVVEGTKPEKVDAEKEADLPEGDVFPMQSEK